VTSRTSAGTFSKRGVNERKASVVSTGAGHQAPSRRGGRGARPCAPGMDRNEGGSRDQCSELESRRSWRRQFALEAAGRLCRSGCYRASVLSKRWGGDSRCQRDIAFTIATDSVAVMEAQLDALGPGVRFVIRAGADPPHSQQQHRLWLNSSITGSSIRRPDQRRCFVLRVCNESAPPVDGDGRCEPAEDSAPSITKGPRGATSACSGDGRVLQSRARSAAKRPSPPRRSRLGARVPPLEPPFPSPGRRGKRSLQPRHECPQVKTRVPPITGHA
jgi:hypothetical protein